MNKLEIKTTFSRQIFCNMKIGHFHLFLLSDMDHQRKISKSKQRHKRFLINTKSAPKAIGPYNQAVMINNTLYISGQLGLDPTTMEIVEGGVVEEAIQVSPSSLKIQNLFWKHLCRTRTRFWYIFPSHFDYLQPYFTFFIKYTN